MKTTKEAVLKITTGIVFINYHRITLSLNHATIHIFGKKFFKLSDDMQFERDILSLKMIQDHVDPPHLFLKGNHEIFCFQYF